MDEQPKRPGSLTFLLMALVLLVTAAGVFGGFVPLYSCIDCAIRRGIPKGDPKDIENCGYCHGKGRATLFQHWLGKRDPGLYSPKDVQIINHGH